MFSATVRAGITLNSWWTTAIPRAIASCGLRRVTGCPWKKISPASAVYTPERIFISVLLPAPFSPITA